MNPNDYKIAELSEDQLSKIKIYEEKTDTCIVALESRFPTAKLSDDELNLTIIAYDPKGKK